MTTHILQSSRIRAALTKLVAAAGLALTLFALAPTPAFAAALDLDANPTGEYGNGTYSWDAETGTITFSAGIGTAIGDIYDSDAIYRNSNVKHVVVAEGVTSVGSSLLLDCDGIQTVSLPASLEAFGSTTNSTQVALPGCTIKGAGFTVAPGNSHYRAIDGSLYSSDGSTLFRYVQKNDADDYLLPNSVSLVKKYALQDNVFGTLTLGGSSCKVEDYALSNTTVAYLKLEEGLVNLGNGSIEGLQDSTMHIPSTLTTIKDADVDAYTPLFNPVVAAFDVDPQNAAFESIDGVLFQKVKDSSGKTTLRLRVYPMAKQGESYTTPANVTAIGACAFGYWKSVANLKELILSPEVTRISSDGIKVGASITRVLVMNKDCDFGYGALRPHQVGTYSTLGATLVAHVGSTAQTYGKNSANQYAVKQLKYFFTDDMLTASPLTFAYDGKAHYPTIDAPLLNGDYEVIPPDDAVSPGTKVLQVVAGGSYDGTISVTYTITDAAAKLSKIKLAASSLSYTGKALKPAVTVTDANGKMLASGTEYDAVYASNTKVGKATVTVTGKGGYSGKLTATFKINPKKASVKSAKAGKAKVTATASTKVGSTGGSTYQIAYRAKGTTKWKTVSTTAQSKVISKLKKGKRYQVRIRAYKKVGATTYNGSWSAIKTTAAVK